MRVFGHISTPTLFCAFWFALVSAMFVLSVGEDFALLSKKYPTENWPEERLRIVPLPKWLTGTDQPAPSGEPTVSELLSREHSPEAMLASHGQGREESPYGEPPTAQAPGTVTLQSAGNERNLFALRLDLGQKPPETRISFQPSPAAWIVDIPGVWKRDAKDLYTFKGAVVRKLRVLVHENRIRLFIYYTNQAAPDSARPGVSMSGTQLTVTVHNP